MAYYDAQVDPSAPNNSHSLMLELVGASTVLSVEPEGGGPVMAHSGRHHPWPQMMMHLVEVAFMAASLATSRTESSLLLLVGWMSALRVRA